MNGTRPCLPCPTRRSAAADQRPRAGEGGKRGAKWDFPKIKVSYLVVLKKEILLLRALGSPLFGNPQVGQSVAKEWTT